MRNVPEDGLAGGSSPVLQAGDGRRDHVEILGVGDRHLGGLLGGGGGGHGEVWKAWRVEVDWRWEGGHGLK